MAAQRIRQFFKNYIPDIAEAVLVYRAMVPFDATNLPPVLLDLPGNSTYFVDDTAEIGVTYYYRVATVVNNAIQLSDLKQIVNVATNGPGPQSLIYGNSNIGFYGEVPASEFLTFTQLRNKLGMTAVPGTIFSDTRPWIKMMNNGQVVFFPKMEFSANINGDFFDELHAKKAFYDKPDTARIIVNGQRFKVRLFNGIPPNLNSSSGAHLGTDPVGLGDTEWNRLICSIDNGADPSKLLYPKLGPSGSGIYSKADLLVPYRSVTGDGNLVMEHSTSGGSTQYSNTNTPSYRFLRGVSSSATSTSSMLETWHSAYVSTIGLSVYRYRPILIHEPWRD
jgi:hypothetical protein